MKLIFLKCCLCCKQTKPNDFNVNKASILNISKFLMASIQIHVQMLHVSLDLTSLLLIDAVSCLLGNIFVCYNL